MLKFVEHVDCLAPGLGAELAMRHELDQRVRGGAAVFQGSAAENFKIENCRRCRVATGADGQQPAEASERIKESRAAASPRVAVDVVDRGQAQAQGPGGRALSCRRY